MVLLHKLLLFILLKFLQKDIYIFLLFLSEFLLRPILTLFNFLTLFLRSPLFLFVLQLIFYYRGLISGSVSVKNLSGLGLKVYFIFNKKKVVYLFFVLLFKNFKSFFYEISEKYSLSKIV